MKQIFLHYVDHQRRVDLENELEELMKRHQTAMQSFKEAVSKTRHSYTRGVRRAQIDPVEQMRTYKLSNAKEKTSNSNAKF
jgi:hypothetical protein